MKTVGDLIDELKKHPLDAKLARRTEGYFQCVVPVDWFVVSRESRKFTKPGTVGQETESYGEEQTIVFVGF